MKTTNIRTTAQQGFTLVEMAVVLAVIGLILGAVMIGQDVLRNAEYANIKQSFVDQWKVTYDSYYDRTGVPVGDDQTRPQLMVNGRDVGEGFSSGGDMTGEAGPGAICNQGNNNAADLNVAREDLRDLIIRTGVELAPGRGQGLEDRYVYQDTNGNPQEIQICFQWNPPGTDSGSGNVMVITGLTPDLARYMDRAIDGQADAQEGRFRQDRGADAGRTDRTEAGGEWEADNTFAMGESETGNTPEGGLGGAQDDDQVITVTAHYKMDR